MIEALCRCLRWWRELRAAFRTTPLDVDEWDRIKCEGAPTFPVVDEREPHLASDRRVDEDLGPRVVPGPRNGRKRP